MKQEWVIARLEAKQIKGTRKGRRGENEYLVEPYCHCYLRNTFYQRKKKARLNYYRHVPSHLLKWFY